jgi:hypothetical protein
MKRLYKMQQTNRKTLGQLDEAIIQCMYIVYSVKLRKINVE